MRFDFRWTFNNAIEKKVMKSSKKCEKHLSNVIFFICKANRFLLFSCAEICTGMYRAVMTATEVEEEEDEKTVDQQ